MYKNSEYKSQTKKMILIPNILFVGAKNNLLLGTGKISNFLETQFPFWEKVARPFTSIEPSMMNHLNSTIVEGKIICFMCVC